VAREVGLSEANQRAEFEGNLVHFRLHQKDEWMGVDDGRGTARSSWYHARARTQAGEQADVQDAQSDAVYRVEYAVSQPVNQNTYTYTYSTEDSTQDDVG